MVGGGDPFYRKFWVNWPPLERNRWLRGVSAGLYALPLDFQLSSFNFQDDWSASRQ